jgi:hypothetical protein
MTKTFKFQGDPEGYRWDFPLVPGMVYAGQLQAYHRHSIGELIEVAKKEKDKKFMEEWEEVSNG